MKSSVAILLCSSVNAIQQKTQVNQGQKMQSQLGVFAMSQEKMQLDSEIKSVLQINAAADLKIQSLIDQGIQSEQKSKVESEVEMAAKSLSHLKNMLDAEQKQKQKSQLQQQLKIAQQLQLKQQIKEGIKHQASLSADQKSQMLAEVETSSELKNLVENKWGFLKNIININTFFSNPDEVTGESKPKSETAVERMNKIKNVEAIDGAFDKGEASSENQIGNDQDEGEDLEKDMNEDKQERARPTRDQEQERPLQPESAKRGENAIKKMVRKVQEGNQKAQEQQQQQEQEQEQNPDEHQAEAQETRPAPHSESRIMRDTGASSAHAIKKLVKQVRQHAEQEERANNDSRRVQETYNPLQESQQQNPDTRRIEMGPPQIVNHEQFSQTSEENVAKELKSQEDKKKTEIKKEEPKKTEKKEEAPKKVEEASKKEAEKSKEAAPKKSEKTAVKESSQSLVQKKHKAKKGASNKTDKKNLDKQKVDKMEEIITKKEKENDTEQKSIEQQIQALKQKQNKLAQNKKHIQIVKAKVLSKAKEVKGQKDVSNVQEQEEISISEKKNETDSKQSGPDESKKITEEKDSKKNGLGGEQVYKTDDDKKKEEATKKNDDPVKENGEFSAIEILVPTTELAKDKELINKIKPPKWESYTYVNENGKCISKHHDNEEEAKTYYKTELMNDPKANRMILAQGNVVQKSASNTFELQKCLGKSILDGNLKRKSFTHGQYYVVNQTDLGKQPYNIVERYKNVAEAQKAFKDVKVDKGFSKILVNGSDGKILQQEGDRELVGQNLLYMYEHIQGRVYNGKFVEQN